MSITHAPTPRTQCWQVPRGRARNGPPLLRLDRHVLAADAAHVPPPGPQRPCPAVPRRCVGERSRTIGNLYSLCVVRRWLGCAQCTRFRYVYIRLPFEDSARLCPCRPHCATRIHSLVISRPPTRTRLGVLARSYIPSLCSCVIAVLLQMGLRSARPVGSRQRPSPIRLALPCARRDGACDGWELTPALLGACHATMVLASHGATPSVSNGQRSTQCDGRPLSLPQRRRSVA